MQQNQKKWVVGIVCIVALLAAFMSGASYGQNLESSQLASANHVVNKNAPLGQTDVDFAPFWKAWQVLNQKYVTAASSTDQDKVWGAIKGLAASEGDPYTVFFPPEESKMFASDIAGNFEGVGMEIDVKDGILTVVAPLKGSPAEKAGIKAGDKILKIDDKSTADLGVDAAIKMIRGKKGTTVKVSVYRDSTKETLDKNITRDVIDIPTVETEVKSASGATATADNGGSGLRSDGIFVIRLFSFSADSPNLFRNALREFVQSGSHKLVLDLRGNPGGYLEAAWDMASWFLPAGDVIVTEDFGQSAPPQVYRSKGYNIFDKNLKFVILVDGGSASASEILAGALKEHGVAKLVGTKTFGKGSVQELINITPDTSLKVTVARWLTPNGNSISKHGIEPDYNVPVTPDDVAKKNDKQMQKAVEVLNQ